MIEISRLLALQFRSVCRRLGVRTSVHATPTIQLAAGPDGLRIRALGRDVALEHVLPGAHPVCAFSLPLAALSEVAGTKQLPVTLTPISGGAVRLTWSEGPIPKQLDIDTAGPPPAGFPELPANLVPNPATLHQALRHAVATADRLASSRYALQSIKLDAAAGRILTTDGRQALVQSGFTFPWDGDAILPGTKVFDAAELVGPDPIAVGRLGEWVAFTFGRWIVYLKRDADAQFPKVDSVLGRPATARAKLNLSEGDAEFLRRSLDVMPTEAESNDGVTIDLNGHVAVRSRADSNSPPTEVVLANSSYTGTPIRATCDRQFLGRALKFGFRSLYLDAPDSPMYCDDGSRHYLWMPLPSAAAVPPAENAVRIESVAEPAAEAARTCSFPRNRRNHTMSRHAHGHTTTNLAAATQPAGELASATAPVGAAPRNQKRRRAIPAASTLDEAVAMRDALRNAFGKSRELVRAIKRHNRQSRLVATTLQSLKQLQAVA